MAVQQRKKRSKKFITFVKNSGKKYQVYPFILNVNTHYSQKKVVTVLSVVKTLFSFPILRGQMRFVVSHFRFH